MSKGPTTRGHGAGRGQTGGSAGASAEASSGSTSNGKYLSQDSHTQELYGSVKAQGLAPQPISGTNGWYYKGYINGIDTWGQNAMPHTTAAGFTFGAQFANFNLDFAVGKFHAYYSRLGFNSGKYASMQVCKYASMQGGPNIGVPEPELHAGGEVTHFNNGDYTKTMQGKYLMKGVNLDFGVAGGSYGQISVPNAPDIIGEQLSLTFESPSILPLPAGYYNVGYGVTFFEKSGW
jgi:hypothetical protein